MLKVLIAEDELMIADLLEETLIARAATRSAASPAP